MPTPEFSKMHISAGGIIEHGLRKHRVFTSDLGDFSFVIAHDRDREAALAKATALAATGRATYTVLFTAENLNTIRDKRKVGRAANRRNSNVTQAQLRAAYRPLQLAVLDAANNHQPAEQQIRASSSPAVSVPIEQNATARPVRAVVMPSDVASLRRGDLFTCGDSASEGKETRSLLYRALADYDPAAGTVLRHLVTGDIWPPTDPADTDKLTSTVTWGPDHLVHVVTDRWNLLDKLALEDIAEHDNNPIRVNPNREHRIPVPAIVDALRAQRVLQYQMGRMHAVIAHTDSRDAALAAALAALADTDYHRVYTVLLNDDQLTALELGIPFLLVPALRASRGHRPDGVVRILPATPRASETMFGSFTTEPVTTDRLRRGDLFAVGEPMRDATGDDLGLMVCRATGDYDPNTGNVDLHEVVEGWNDMTDQARAEFRIPDAPAGPDRIVDRITDPAAFRHKLGLTDLATAES